MKGEAEDILLDQEVEDRPCGAAPPGYAWFRIDVHEVRSFSAYVPARSSDAVVEWGDDVELTSWGRDISVRQYGDFTPAPGEPDYEAMLRQPGPGQLSFLGEREIITVAVKDGLL